MVGVRNILCAALALTFLAASTGAGVAVAADKAHGATAAASAEAVTGVSHMDVLRAISRNKGKVVVVNFFASWCQPCRLEVPHLKALRQAFPEDKLVVLGYSVDDDPDAYKAFAAEMGFPYPVAWSGPEVPRVFQVQSIPKTLMYGTSGELAVAHDGYMSAEELHAAVDSLLGK